jgi:hypothetical protein
MKDLTNELLNGGNLLAEAVDQVETEVAIQEELQNMSNPAALLSESMEDMLFNEDARIDGNDIEMPSDAGIDSLQFFNQDNIGQNVADSSLTGLDPDRQNDFGNSSFAASNPKGKDMVQLRSAGDNVALGESGIPSLFSEGGDDDECNDVDNKEIADGIDDQSNIGDDDTGDSLEESLKLFEDDDDDKDDDSNSDVEEDDEDDDDEEYEDELGL